MLDVSKAGIAGGGLEEATHCPRFAGRGAVVSFDGAHGAHQECTVEKETDILGRRRGVEVHAVLLRGRVDRELASAGEFRDQAHLPASVWTGVDAHVAFDHGPADLVDIARVL